MNIFEILISPAMAQGVPSIGGFDIMSILPLALIFVVFYFFLIRPQQKKAQLQKNMLSSLRRGDRIVTNGGLIGVVTKVVNDQELQVEIAEDVKVRVARAMVADLLSKTEPANDMPEKSELASEKKSASKPAMKSKTKSIAKAAVRRSPSKPARKGKKGA
jgi:preprotein translocase subunit YajC